VREDELKKLREIVLAVHDERVDYRALFELASELEEGSGLTVDFRASKALGQPMVVVRAGRGPEVDWSSLTAREREVALLVAEGHRNADIARKLSISLATVKDHVHHILDKTQLKSRTALAGRLGAQR